MTKQSERKSILFAISTLWNLSKKRVICEATLAFLGYAEWVFYSAFFMRFVINSITNELPFKTILFFILLTALFFMISAVFKTWVQTNVVAFSDIQIYKGLYSKLYKKAGNVELKCFEKPEFYNKYTLATKDAANTLVITVKSFFNSVCGAIASIVIFYTMFDIDKFAVLFVAAPLLGNFVFGPLLNKEETSLINEQAKATRKMDYVNRAIHLADYAKEIRLTNIFSVLQRMYKQAVGEVIQLSNKHSFKIILWYWFKVYFTYTVIFQGVLIYGVIRAGITKSMTLTELAILSSIMVSATWILITFTGDLMNTYKNSLLLKNVMAFLNYKEDIPEDFDGIKPSLEVSSIEFKNVSFFYTKDKPIIQNLSFTITGNKSVALVGNNGAGKTTIIKLLLRMYDPSEGEILVNGINIKEYNLFYYRSLFQGAFQDFKLFAATVRENVLMRTPSYTKDEEVKVCDALKKAGVWEKVSEMKNGIDTILTKEFCEEGEVLSGGQSQKIAVARSFAGDEPIHIYDEPSSALDPIAEADLYDSIIKDSKGRTAIFISHRLSSVKNADNVFMLENGTIIERGTHTELMSQNGEYADMYNKQAKNYLAQTDSQYSSKSQNGGQ